MMEGAKKYTLNNLKEFLERYHFDTTQNIKVTSIGSIHRHKGHIIVRDVQINNGSKDDIFVIVDNEILDYSQGSFNWEDIQASLDNFINRHNIKCN